MSFSSNAQLRTFSKPEEYDRKYLVHTYNADGIRGKEDTFFTHGEGQYLFDQNGQKYLDFCAGIAVTGLGHNDPDWQAALVQGAKQICHTSNLFHTQAPLELAKMLVDHSSFDKVFFCNSGTEANEGAYKFARLYANQKAKGTALEGQKMEFISFKGGFHGRTAAALTLTYKPAIREAFMPLIPGVRYAEYNDIDHVRNLISKKTAGVIIEPIQGEGGVIPANPSFLQELRALCDENDALLITDEVQCGLGRTGKLFAHEWYGINPDIMTLAKPLAGGLPIGAILVRDHVADVVTPGSHGTTFGGNPLICKVAEVVLNKIKSTEFLANVQSRGAYLAQQLEVLQAKYPDKISQVRVPHGRQALFIGVECKNPVNPLTKFALMEKNLLLISAGEKTIRLCPPLIVTQEDIDWVVNTIEEAFINDIL
ncbi:unnamed protein product [Albugo candida]|uniref:acetylornithine transaminase n=1 Tax=Albugo candida TaxID=65357 RepID=A0A024FVS3_9STRA|nr:unnamed protein product [Albugo candida]|eukprot:CCI11131.1 unnamed protein product [Albugo candida]